MWFIFPPHLNSVSALPCKTNTKIASFHLMSYDYFIENFKNTLWMDSLSIVSFRYQNSLQQMFKMSSLCANIRLQMLSPLADSSVNNTLLQTAPNANQSPLEFVDIVDLHLLRTLLHDPPNLVINGVQVRTVGGP